MYDSSHGSISSIVSKLELKQKESLFSIKTLEKTVNNLENMLKKERLKIKILSFLLEKYSDINVSKLFNENEEDNRIQLHIYPGKETEISVIVHDDFKKENEEYDIESKKNELTKITVDQTENQNENDKTGSEKEDKNEIEKVEKPKRVFRSVKKAENEETIEEVEEKIKKVEENFNTMNNEIMDVSVKETTNLIESIFNAISKNRIYKKEIEALKTTRFKLLGKLNIEAYTSLLNSHIEKLKSIFISKKYDNKRINELIQKSLNGLDHRLVFYDSYFNTEILADEHFKLKTTLTIHCDYSKRHIPFNCEEMCKKLFNYGIVIFTLRENILRILNNPYKFFNLIYVNMKTDKTVYDDPYSFYYLEKINPDGKRYWKMDCRLEEISRNIVSNLKFYCINLFRKIYFDIFQDNLFRKDYTEKAIIAKEDLEQLFQNILNLVKKKDFCLCLQEIVIRNCTIIPTVFDKFNLTSDDKVNKKNFMSERNRKEDIEEIIQQIFDKISKDDIQFLIETKCDF